MRKVRRSDMVWTCVHSCRGHVRCFNPASGILGPRCAVGASVSQAEMHCCAEQVALPRKGDRVQSGEDGDEDMAQDDADEGADEGAAPQLAPPFCKMV